MSIWSKLRGTQESSFQLGLGGPQLANDPASPQPGGVVAAYDPSGSFYIPMRAAPPVTPDDVVNARALEEELEKRLKPILARLNKPKRKGVYR